MQIFLDHPVRIHNNNLILISKRSLTIRTTSTSASIRSWYIYCSRSFFISTGSSSVCATVNNRIRQRAQTLFRFKRKATRKRRPPSWIIHQISIVPSWICLLSGKLSTFFGTMTAHCRASATAIVPIRSYDEKSHLIYRSNLLTNKSIRSVTIKISSPLCWPTKNNCIRS